MKARWLGLSVLLLIVSISLYLTGVQADPPSCAPFGDTGCFFGENWDNGTPICANWGCSSFAQSNMVNVTPGFNGTNRAARLLYGNDTSGSSGSGGWADINLGRVSADGDVFWVEWFLQFSPGFFFGPGGPNGDFPSFKNFEWQGGTSTPGCENRILLTFVGQSSTNYATAFPEWYIGPNFGEVAACTTANPTAPGSQNLGGFVLPSGIGSNFTIQGGVLYRIVTEFKSQNNKQGYIKTWVNGQLVMQATQMTTCANHGAGCNWSVIRFGGQFGKTIAGSYGDWDQIRATTTNISPTTGDVTPPVVTITTPVTSATHNTGNTTVNLAGTASDAVGVTTVTWVNDRGGSGSATGTTSWSVNSIPLATGVNTITVTARDAALNAGTATLTVTSQPDTACSSPSVIFCETWEAATPLPGQWTDISGTHTITTNAANVYQGSKALETTWIPGTGGPGWLTRWFRPDGQPTTPVTGVDRVFAREMVKIESTFTACNPNCPKFFALYGSRTDAPFSGFGQAGNKPTGTDWFYSGYAAAQSGPRNLIMYDYDVNMVCTPPNCFGQNILLSPTTQAPLNTWFCIESEVQMNTPGVSNGVHRAWLNGVLMGERTNVRWRDSTILNLNAFQLTFSGDPAVTSRIWHDNVVVATARIGCGGPAVAVPAPPTGFRFGP